MHKTSLLLVVTCLLKAGVASAHIQLISPPDRFTNNSLSPGPCGSGTRSSKPPTKLVPGQALVVSWKEVVSHAGHYRIALSASESSFTDPTNLTVPNPAPSWVLVDGIRDKTGNQTYTQSVQIPNKECPACVLQVIQAASSGSDGTNGGSLFTVYHACADVSISGDAVDAGAWPDALRAQDAAARGDVAAVDGTVSVDGSAGQTGSGGSAASNGGASGASGSTGRTGGNLAGGSGSRSTAQATGGQGDRGGVSSGGTTTRGASAGTQGGRSSSVAAQGGGGSISAASTDRASGGTRADSASGLPVAGTSAAGGSRAEKSQTGTSGGCHIGQGPPSSPWFVLALALLVRSFLRKRLR